jgi:hypothetical protein
MEGMHQTSPYGPPEEARPAPLPDPITIMPQVNGWMIHRGNPPAIVVEKIEGRDNIAFLLAQVGAMLGDKL